ncbi:MAG: hypothetical protein F9K19_13010 [Rhizobiaceae bacterium]|nr:MAG: hypothetical protein F9K19_13010 [Rhizobiaceae bacterium]CAG1015938.1 hypothetical protein RHIZO_05215 [Rhizobiaceae bacterium]
MNTDLFITALVSMMTNAVLFGAGAITVLSVPTLNDQAKYLLPVVIVASFILAPLVAWFIAPRLRARNWRRPEPAAA